MAIGISSSSGDNTGIDTGNPQSIAQNSILQTGGSNLQSPVNPNNVTTNSSTIIPLSTSTVNTSTAAIKEITQPKHQISGVEFIPIAAILVIAIVSSTYIYTVSKNPNKYS